MSLIAKTAKKVFSTTKVAESLPPLNDPYALSDEEARLANQGTCPSCFSDLTVNNRGSGADFIIDLSCANCNWAYLSGPGITGLASKNAMYTSHGEEVSVWWNVIDKMMREIIWTAATEEEAQQFVDRVTAQGDPIAPFLYVERMEAVYEGSKVVALVKKAQTVRLIDTAGHTWLGEYPGEDELCPVCSRPAVANDVHAYAPFGDPVNASKTAAPQDGDTSFCRICGIEMQGMDYAWYALKASSPQREVGSHHHIPARLSGRPGEFGPDGVLVPGTPGGEGGQYDAPAGTIFDAGANPIQINSKTAAPPWMPMPGDRVKVNGKPGKVVSQDFAGYYSVSFDEGYTEREVSRRDMKQASRKQASTEFSPGDLVVILVEGDEFDGIVYRDLGGATVEVDPIDDDEVEDHWPATFNRDQVRLAKASRKTARQERIIQDPWNGDRWQAQYFDPEMKLWFDIGDGKDSKEEAEANLSGFHAESRKQAGVDGEEFFFSDEYLQAAVLQNSALDGDNSWGFDVVGPNGRQSMTGFATDWDAKAAAEQAMGHSNPVLWQKASRKSASKIGQRVTIKSGPDAGLTGLISRQTKGGFFVEIEGMETGPYKVSALSTKTARKVANFTEKEVEVNVDGEWIRGYVFEDDGGPTVEVHDAEDDPYMVGAPAAVPRGDIRAVSSRKTSANDPQGLLAMVVEWEKVGREFIGYDSEGNYVVSVTDDDAEDLGIKASRKTGSWIFLRGDAEYRRNVEQEINALGGSTTAYNWLDGFVIEGDSEYLSRFGDVNEGDSPSRGGIRGDDPRLSKKASQNNAELVREALDEFFLLDTADEGSDNYLTQKEYLRISFDSLSHRGFGIADEAASALASDDLDTVDDLLAQMAESVGLPKFSKKANQIDDSTRSFTLNQYDQFGHEQENWIGYFTDRAVQEMEDFWMSEEGANAQPYVPGYADGTLKLIRDEKARRGL